MIVLGIESSCDESAFALVKGDMRPDARQPYAGAWPHVVPYAENPFTSPEAQILGSTLSSQVDLHALFGGVVPELASRQHAACMGPLLDNLLQQLNFPLEKVDAVAVARGPGLLGSLLVGVGFAKSLALGLSVPFIGVNHLHAHLLAAGLEQSITFPALGVLVSGGHTHLYVMKNPLEMEVLGKTIDDAAGEACDKFAKMLGLPYPGGALLDALSKRGTPDPKLFPRPLTKSANQKDLLNFSFSGLKTAAATWLKNTQTTQDLTFLDPTRSIKENIAQAPKILCDVAASYLYAIADTLCIKARLALEAERAKALSGIKGASPCTSLVLAGGVAANSMVRAHFESLAKEKGLPLFIPSPPLCTDNAAMVAYTGYCMARAGIRHPLSLPALARGCPIPEPWEEAIPFDGNFACG